MALTIPTRPVLESGDRLTRTEFHRRYCARPDIKRAELVAGVVYVATPATVFHGEPHAQMVGWLGVYKAKHPGVHLGSSATVLLDVADEVQPDAVLWRQEANGPRETGDGYLEGSPQLVGEIAASSVSYDLHDKKEAYRRTGVQEYIVWRVFDGMIDWFRLRAGEYVWIEPDEVGVIESEAFPGLRLHLPKLLAGDLAGVLAELERGTAG